MLAIKTLVEGNPYWVWAALVIAGAVSTWVNHIRMGKATWNPKDYWWNSDPVSGRSTLALLALACGTPLFTGGDDGAFIDNGALNMTWQALCLLAWTSGAAIDAMIQPKDGGAHADVATKQGGFINLRLLVLLIVVGAGSMSLAGCAGGEIRDERDGALYARKTLDSVYDSVVYLRGQKRIDDQVKQKVMDATAGFEIVLRLVEDGKNPVMECVSIINGSLAKVDTPPLISATSCLNAAVQGLTTVRSLLDAKNGH